MRHPVWAEMNNITMYECPSCNSLTTYPMPDNNLLALCYAKYAKSGYPSTKADAKKESKQNLWYRDILKSIHFRIRPGEDVADVGAGEGWLAKEILNSDETVNVFCFDHHVAPDGLMKSLTTAQRDRLQWNIIELNECNWRVPATYDHVFCISVIEHITKPALLINELYKICKPGGKIYIIGPDADSLMYKFMMKKWIYIIPGEHLTIPGFKGLATILKRLPDIQYDLNRINVTYSLKYIIESIGKFAWPSVLDFTLRIPAGAFVLIVSKSKK